MRVAAGREPSPSEAAVDSQSVETATMISQEVGYDVGKKIHGRKRHLTVDLLGLVLRVLVTSASLPERQGARQVLKRVHDTGNRVKRLHTIWMDGGYRGEEFMRWVMDMFRWIVEIVLRPLEKKGFVHLPKRWVVERTFGWLNWCRRLSKDYERLPETSETFIYIAMIRIMLLTSSLLLTTEVAYAVESAPVTLVQAFGWDPAKAAYKILIQSRNGNQYFVWYSNLIGAKVGSVITLTYEGSGSSMYFYKLINTGNGKESSVLRYLKAN